MQSQTVEIRLELLKKIGEGYSTRETVKHLAEKFGISISGAYYHFENREKWLPQYADFDKDYAFQIKQRNNHIYRECMFRYLHAADDNARIGYLRTALDANARARGFLPQDKEGELLQNETLHLLYFWDLEKDETEEDAKHFIEMLTPGEQRIVQTGKKLWRNARIDYYHKVDKKNEKV